MNAEQNNAIEKLKTSPMFCLSLSSKELFHSNFWAWLFDLKNTESVKGYEFIRVFFPDFPDTHEYTVYREKDNMDIQIELNQPNDHDIDLYVIENKIKSYPDPEQLESYSNKIKKTFRGLLTFFIHINFDPVENWSYIQLSEIISKLREISNNDFNNIYHKQLLEDYIVFTDNLLDLFLNMNQCSDLFYFDKDFLKKCEMVKIHDLYWKLRMNSLKKYVDHLRSSGNFCHLDSLKTGVGFSNGSGVFEIYFDDPIKGSSIGIQIQGCQYRYFIRSKSEKIKTWINSKDNKQDVPDGFSFLLNNEWFCDNPKTKYGSPMRNRFCFFNPDFIYQYKSISPNESFPDLSEQILGDMKNAFPIWQTFVTQCL